MPKPFACTDPTCTNTNLEHTAPRGCVHEASDGSWVPDRHDKPGRGDSE